MKQKHNKKRNTAFIFEALIRELTKNIVGKNDKNKLIIISLIKENFHTNTLLGKDLSLYRGILETKNVDHDVAEKLIFESRMQHCVMDKKELFTEQTKVINKINKLLSKDIFSNFIPNYRDIATLYQIFNPGTNTKQRVLMEKQLINKMTAPVDSPPETMEALDNLTLKTFTKNFNDKYNGSLLPEQKDLLGKYIASFNDNGAELKLFLNEEVARLKEVLNNTTQIVEIQRDDQMIEKTQSVLDILNEFRTKPIDQKMVQDILKIQNLIKEINS
jgi:hypothetical protein